MRLGPVGLPEERSGGGAQLRDGTARFGGGDGPGSEGADLAEVGRDGGMEMLAVIVGW